MDYTHGNVGFRKEVNGTLTILFQNQAHFMLESDAQDVAKWFSENYYPQNDKWTLYDEPPRVYPGRIRPMPASQFIPDWVPPAGVAMQAQQQNAENAIQQGFHNAFNALVADLQPGDIGINNEEPNHG